MTSLSELIRERSLLICVGSGGVGKTTCAASVSLRAAQEGRKVLVLTIDPARRLANSLGMKRFGNEQVRVDLAGLGHAEGGELWAMMLDNRRTFDELIRKVSPTDEVRDRILANKVYRGIADSVAGSQDYMATEKLHDVVVEGDFDLVVLDTPPVKNALDFLDAPGRLTRFLDKKIMKWFLTPYEEGRLFGRLMMGTSAIVYKLLGFIFGKDFLGDLSEFFLSFRDLYDGFRERHERVIGLFHSPKTAFLVVCAPNAPSVDVARYFLGELRARRMATPGVIVNQRHETLGEQLFPAELLGEAAHRLGADLAPHTAQGLLARLGAAHRRLRELSLAETDQVDRVRREMREGQRIWTIPRLERDVHDLEGLALVADRLFARDGADPAKS